MQLISGISKTQFSSYPRSCCVSDDLFCLAKITPTARGVNLLYGCAFELLVAANPPRMGSEEACLFVL